MNNPRITIKIALNGAYANYKVYVEYNPNLKRWAHSDNGVSWQFLPANIKQERTAIEWAINHYGLT